MSLRLQGSSTSDFSTAASSKKASEYFESFREPPEHEEQEAALPALGRPREQNYETLAPDRKMWATDTHLVLACLGIVLGMANLWRFPKAVYENGGGSFLLAYVIVLAVVGYPLFYLELIMGQYTRLGPSALTRCVPLAKGVEMGMAFVGFAIAVCLNVVLAQSVLHLFLTFIDLNLLPVSGCYGFWERELETCYRIEKKICQPSQARAPANVTRGRGHLTSANDPHYLRPYRYDDAVMDCVNITETMNEHFVHVSIGMNNRDVGTAVGIQPELTICLGLSWSLLFVCISTGLTTSRKKSSAIALVPMALSTLLMVSTVWQNGAGYGLLYLVIPKWEKLLNVTIWTNAVIQLFFNLGLAHGPILLYGSYNNFYTDNHRAAFIVLGLSFGASMMYCIIIFSSLGRLAFHLNIPVEKVIHGGQSIMFVAMNKYSVHWTLSSLFFVLAVVAGTNSQVAAVEIATAHLCDMFPEIHYNKRPFALLYCFAGFVFGLPLVTEGGSYLLHMVDSQVTGFLLSYSAFLEVIVVAWVYGVEHLKLDIMLLNGETSTLKLEYAWRLLIPVILGGTVLASLVTGCSSLRFGPIDYPLYACYIGWSIIIVGALQVPFWALISSFSANQPLEQCLLPASCQEMNISGSDPLDVPRRYRHNP
ncbi:sodium-dependent nutrient amino acid transporter 1-like [Ornithodoros turicata]|uniref:sodium-dependent nutrient amino acid transporter 1-like n=1 Tax=Ornithodoros turicata TaxID=34597 RepID=UPI003139B62E